AVRRGGRRSRDTQAPVGARDFRLRLSGGGDRNAAASALLACLVLSGAAALDATHDLHSSIEVAQGESPQY
ncbi:hypothetical protein ABZY10_32330, partial [Streptomyces sp. NPDC006539]